MKPSRFGVRASGEEIMDDLACSGAVVNQTLRELEVINRLLGGNAVTLRGISELIDEAGHPKSVSIADLGCGGGDILKLVAKWGKRHGVSLQLSGIDANPNIIDFARRHTDEDLNIRYQTENILSEEFRQQQYDIIVATLFTHHFTNDQLVALLRSLKRQARLGIVINDLHRHWLAWYSIRLLTFLFSRSSMVKYDAPLSVLRAFSRKEVQFILAGAGITGYKLRWKWAFRWQLVISNH